MKRDLKSQERATRYYNLVSSHSESARLASPPMEEARKPGIGSASGANRTCDTGVLDSLPAELPHHSPAQNQPRALLDMRRQPGLFMSPETRLSPRVPLASTDCATRTKFSFRAAKSKQFPTLSFETSRFKYDSAGCVLNRAGWDEANGGCGVRADSRRACGCVRRSVCPRIARRESQPIPFGGCIKKNN